MVAWMFLTQMDKDIFSLVYHENNLAIYLIYIYKCLAKTEIQILGEKNTVTG